MTDEMTEEEERVIEERMGELEDEERHYSSEEVADEFDIDLD